MKKVEVDEQNMHGWTPLMIVVAQQHEKAAEILLKKGANPNSCNTMGRNSLMFAARYANKTLIELLINYGADPNLNESNDPGILSTAAISGNMEIVKIILDAGAISTQKDYFGKTAIQYAEESKHGEIAALLRSIDLTANDDNE